MKICTPSFILKIIQIESLRLDFIAHLNLDTRHHAPDNVEMEHKLCEIAPNVWGNLFHDVPKSVKVKFYKEGRVWEKVRRDLECRTNGKLYEKNGFLYYEDIVYGFSKFSNWIYGYGSSAIVIEPKWLRPANHSIPSGQKKRVGK